jgi:hydrogenase maturation protease
MTKTLILGIGNLLLSDEGVGVHAIRRLEMLGGFSSNVDIIDGGTLGLSLLPYLEGVSRLIVIDAIETGCEPGTLKRLTGDEIPKFLEQKVTPHETGLPTLLFAAELCGLNPKEVIVWGIQPATIQLGTQLSKVVEAQLDILVENVFQDVIVSHSRDYISPSEFKCSIEM